MNMHYIALIDPYICAFKNLSEFPKYNAYTKGLSEDIFIKSFLTGKNFIGCG